VDIMGRIGIVYNDVAKAAHQLQGKNQNPTVDNIRAILGTGSKSTIATHLRAWKSQQGIIQASDGVIPSELLSIVKGLWERLRETADVQISEYRSEFTSKTKDMQEQLNQYQRQNTVLQTQIHNLEEQLHQKVEAATQLESILTAEQHEKAKITERAAALDVQQQDGQAEIKRLHQLLKQVQDNLEHYQAATQSLRQEQSLLLEKQRSEYEQKIMQYQSQITSLATEKSQYQAEYKQIDDQYRTLKKELGTVHSQKEKIQKQHESLALTHQALQQEHQHLTQQYQHHLDKLETKSHALIESQVTIKANTDKIKILEQTISKSKVKIQALRHDYEFVIQEKANLAGQIKQLEAAIPRIK